MSASQIKKDTLKQLRAARVSMMSVRWMLAIEKKDPATQKLAAKELLRVHHAILKLENEQLANIRDKLLENEAALARGTDKLGRALKNLKQVQSVLRAVTGLLAIVARVAAIMV